jgi:hypothetical protein
MDRIQLYKEFYFKELSRKVELDNAINLPILIITSIVSINVYYVKTCQGIGYYTVHFLAGVISFFLLKCLYKLSKSYFNLGEANTYSELEGMNEQFNYDQLENKAIEFELHFEKSLAIAAGHNFKINKSRTEDLAKGKKDIFISVFITIISTFFYVITLIINQ